MVFPFEKMAEQGLPMPDDLDLPDQMAYRFLVGLYRDIRTGTITRDQAVEEKGKMTYQHSVAKNILKNSSVMGSYWAGLRKDVEAAHNAYRKNPSRKTADALSAALDGRLDHATL